MPFRSVVNLVVKFVEFKKRSQAAGNDQAAGFFLVLNPCSSVSAHAATSRCPAFPTRRSGAPHPACGRPVDDPSLIKKGEAFPSTTPHQARPPLAKNAGGRRWWATTHKPARTDGPRRRYLLKMMACPVDYYGPTRPTEFFGISVDRALIDSGGNKKRGAPLLLVVVAVVGSITTTKRKFCSSARCYCCCCFRCSALRPRGSRKEQKKRWRQRSERAKACSSNKHTASSLAPCCSARPTAVASAAVSGKPQSMASVAHEQYTADQQQEDEEGEEDVHPEGTAAMP